MTLPQGTPWDVLRPALLAAVASLPSAIGGVPVQVSWADAAQDIVSDVTRCCVKLAILNVLGDAGWEARAAYDAAQAPNTLQDTITAYVRFVLRARVESYEQTDSGVAAQVAEQIRNRSKRRSVLDTLRNGFNLALIETLQSVEPSTKFDKHAVSVSVVDLRFAYGMQEADPNRYPNIETVTTPVGTLTP